MMYQYLRYEDVKESTEQLQEVPALPRSIILFKGFLLNPWEFLFDWLIHLTYPQDPDDYDDGDVENAK